MFRLARLILHQQKVIHEYERLCEHLLVEMATRELIPHRPFSDDLVPDAGGLCSELADLLSDAKAPDLKSAYTKKESLS